MDAVPGDEPGIIPSHPRKVIPYLSGRQTIALSHQAQFSKREIDIYFI